METTIHGYRVKEYHQPVKHLLGTRLSFVLTRH